MQTSSTTLIMESLKTYLKSELAGFNLILDPYHEPRLTLSPRVSSEVVSKIVEGLKFKATDKKQWSALFYGRGGLRPAHANNNRPARVAEKVGGAVGAPLKAQLYRERMAEMDVRVMCITNSFETATAIEERLTVFRPQGVLSYQFNPGVTGQAPVTLSGSITGFSLDQLEKQDSAAYGSIVTILMTFTISYPIVLFVGEQRLIRSIVCTHYIDRVAQTQQMSTVFTNLVLRCWDNGMYYPIGIKKVGDRPTLYVQQTAVEPAPPPFVVESPHPAISQVPESFSNLFLKCDDDGFYYRVSVVRMDGVPTISLDTVPIRMAGGLRIGGTCSILTMIDSEGKPATLKVVLVEGSPDWALFG